MGANPPHLLGDLVAGLGRLKKVKLAGLSTHIDYVPGKNSVEAEEKLRAVAASAEAASLLGLQEGAPLLSVDRVAFTYGDRPVELRRGLYHTEADHYRNQLN